MLFYYHQVETPEKNQRFNSDEPYIYYLPFERAFLKTEGEWSNTNCYYKRKGTDPLLNRIVLFRNFALPRSASPSSDLKRRRAATLLTLALALRLTPHGDPLIELMRTLQSSAGDLARNMVC